MLVNAYELELKFDLDKKNNTIKYSAHGKFLITGEYAVLDNVPALAVPLQLNQYLKVSSRNDNMITWKSYDEDGSLWFETSLEVAVLKEKSFPTPEDSIARKLIEVLRVAIEINPKAIEKIETGFEAITTLDFNRKFGMGTSSTLISLIAQWLECDAYALQFECFGGSGYDIACATANSALIYNYNDAKPSIEFLNWNPEIKESIFFVYLNRKQNSRDSIARFESSLLTDELREELSVMPQKFIESSQSLTEFETAIKRHETIIASLIGLETAQKKLFPDFTGAVKSLGGWGGDFVMCTGRVEEREYFKSRSYDVVLEWDSLVL